MMKTHAFIEAALAHLISELLSEPTLHPVFSNIEASLGSLSAMRKSDLKARHASFDEAVNRYRSFSEKILNAQRIIGTSAEKRDLAESVILRLVANWESFVDEHLVACVNRDHSRLHLFLGVNVPAHPDMNLCRALIFGDGYRDFQSMGALIGFSRKLLPIQSSPFEAISKSHRTKIDDIYKVRNYLAHYSAKSKRVLWDMYKKRYKYQRWIEPGRFLLATGGKRLWECFDAFAGASTDMKAWY